MPASWAGVRSWPRRAPIVVMNVGRTAGYSSTSCHPVMLLGAYCRRPAALPSCHLVPTASGGRLHSARSRPVVRISSAWGAFVPPCPEKQQRYDAVLRNRRPQQNPRNSDRREVDQVRSDQRIVHQHRTGRRRPCADDVRSGPDANPSASKATPATRASGVQWRDPTAPRSSFARAPRVQNGLRRVGVAAMPGRRSRRAMHASARARTLPTCVRRASSSRAWVRRGHPVRQTRSADQPAARAEFPFSFAVLSRLRGDPRLSGAS